MFLLTLWYSQKNSTLPAVLGVNVTVADSPGFRSLLTFRELIEKLWSTVPAFLRLTVTALPTVALSVVGSCPSLNATFG